MWMKKDAAHARPHDLLQNAGIRHEDQGSGYKLSMARSWYVGTFLSIYK